MVDGDQVGLPAFRQLTSSIGFKRSGHSYALKMTQRMMLVLNDSWQTGSRGVVAVTAPNEKGKVWLQGTLGLAPDGSIQGSFSYSADESAFTSLDPAFNLNDGDFFPGYRWAIYNYATVTLAERVFATVILYPGKLSILYKSWGRS